MEKEIRKDKHVDSEQFISVGKKWNGDYVKLDFPKKGCKTKYVSSESIKGDMWHKNQLLHILGHW